MIKKTLILMISIIMTLVGCGVVLADGIITTRIKDIARLEGVRDNQLTGMGLVVGLNGTGDSSKANIQVVINALNRLGYNSPITDLKVKNVAAVFLTATLPPYMHQGDAIDVQVSSYGDAKSLQGGVLLQSPLTGADGKVYAVAQGSIYSGGYNNGSRGTTQQKNITTSGTLPKGALVEKEVPMELQINGKLRWALNNPDFTTATRLAKTINDNIAGGVAKAIDMGLVEVSIPKDRAADAISYIADIETLPVTPDGLAKVVINERNGTIVIGEKVKIAKVAVTHGNITVKVNTQDQVSQPNPYSGGVTAVTGATQSDTKEDTGSLVELPEGTDIGTVVQALNSVGTTPQDIISVIVAIQQAGALYGVLEFI